MFTRGEVVIINTQRVSDLDGKEAVIKDSEREYVVAQVKGYQNPFLFLPNELVPKNPRY